TRLLLSSKYAQIANYWKYFDGEAEQLKKNKVYEKKATEEKAFSNWAASKAEYKSLLYDIDQAYTLYKPYALQRVYIGECVLAPNSMLFAYQFNALESIYSEIEKTKSNKEMSKTAKDSALNMLDLRLKTMVLILKSAVEGTPYTDRIVTADKKIFAGMMKMYYKNIPADQWPEAFTKIASKIKNGNSEEVFAKYTDMIYKKSMFSSVDKMMAFLDKPSHSKLLKDPEFQYMKAHLENYLNNFASKYGEFYNNANELGGKYIKGLMEMYPDRIFYPDANSSQRLTYGTVQSYDPKDAVHYNYYTTIEGVLEKYVPGDYEFDLPSKLIELYKNKDYGRYAMENGQLPVCFLTNNDITGGNSGSPVMDGNGHIIGLAFDGNWEAMSGNIHFDKELKRCINVDIRYVLWLIEKLGGAKHIVDEMKLVE
ncbi:MAG: S46 family peptidase, partial [Bacteroidia bacterium]